MIKLDENSNAQSWELEVTCKSKKYLDEVVIAILKYGVIDFEINNIEYYQLEDKSGGDGKWTVLMWCSWFDNLKSIASDLSDIEERLQ